MFIFSSLKFSIKADDLSQNALNAARFVPNSGTRERRKGKKTAVQRQQSLITQDDIH